GVRQPAVGVLAGCAPRSVVYERLLGFYRGIQASYLGIAETSLQHLLIEMVLAESAAADGMENCRITAEYQQGLTRLKFCEPAYAKEGLKVAPGLVQTVRLVVKEEGFRAMYKGLLTHLFARRFLTPV
uniref:ADP,ATP carrier protein n=1 Tax=Macrostomum lignano TaxID=282301 RepID=A0A1I8F4Z4_9PLAT